MILKINLTMQFQAYPILDIMIEFYQQPRGRARFDEYIEMMYDRRNDRLKLPIPHFNPMGKAHIPKQLLALKELGAEELLDTICEELNTQIATRSDLPAHTIHVILSLADDLMGGWTNKYSTDYSNNFNPRGMINHHYTSPIFWTSESPSTIQIDHRIRTSLWRTVYLLQHAYPETLIQHLKQEAFVQNQVGTPTSTVDPEEYELILDFVKSSQQSEVQSTIITFFYGDVAAESLGYPSLGFEANTGFHLAAKLVTDLGLNPK